MPRKNFIVKQFQSTLFFDKSFDPLFTLSLLNDLKEFFMKEGYKTIFELNMNNSKNIANEDDKNLDTPLIQAIFQKDGEEGSYQVLVGYIRADIVYNFSRSCTVEIDNLKAEGIEKMFLKFFEMVKQFKKQEMERKATGIGIMTVSQIPGTCIEKIKKLLNVKIKDYTDIDFCAVTIGFSKKVGMKDIHEVIKLNPEQKTKSPKIIMIGYDWNNLKFLGKDSKELKRKDIKELLEEYQNNLVSRVKDYV